MDVSSDIGKILEDHESLIHKIILCRQGKKIDDYNTSIINILKVYPYTIEKNFWYRNDAFDVWTVKKTIKSRLLHSLTWYKYGIYNVPELQSVIENKRNQILELKTQINKALVHGSIAFV
jgi:hypothetical protein